MDMINNFSFKVILGISDTDAQKYFSDLIGHETKASYSTTISDSHTSYTTTELRSWAIEPDELAHLGKKLVLVHPDGYLLLRKIFYFEK